MKKLLLYTSMLVFTLLAFAQNDKSKDFVLGTKDEMTVRERQRQIYKQMYDSNPYEAIDSLTASKRALGSEKGLTNLAQYQSNTRIDTLKEIDLSYAGLEEIPEFVYLANSAEVLILDYNHIRKLPKELSALPNLKRIYWRANDLDKVWWIRIQGIDGLEKLDISNNLLTRLPVGIKHLDGLKELGVNENFLGEIPISRLSKARFIEKVSFNKSHSIKVQSGDYSQLDFVKILTINNSHLSTIDKSLYQMKNLDELQLQENQLETIPEGISQMKKLTKLSFYKNELISLPDDLFDLNLKVIDLYYNDIEVVPEAIGNFKELEILFLAHNRIYSLPESIGSLDKLKELYVHHNRLSVLPESIANLQLLTTARVNDNYLTEFPVQFLGMKYLVDLDISNNQLTTLDERLELLPALELLSYQENPINFNGRGNDYISPMIVRMLERGVTCVPRIYKQDVAENEGD